MKRSARGVEADPTWAQPLDALFVGAHPDDVELFAGGTAARLAALGYRVGICDLTAGELASNGTPQQRRAESLEAARLLGATLPRIVLGLPDGALDERDAAQLLAAVGLLRLARPRLLCAPAAFDRHPDHEAASRLARRAVFFAGVHAYAAPGAPFRPQGVMFYVATRDLEPTFLVDVTAHMASRRAAILAHVSQFVAAAASAPTFINRAGYLDGLEARMAAWGARVGAPYAEGFLLESTPQVSDPVAWLCPPSPQEVR